MSVFVEIMICMENTDGEKKDMPARVNPGEIAYYYPGFNWGSVLVFKSGVSFLSTLSIDEVDSILQQYSVLKKKNPMTAGILRPITNAKKETNAAD